MSFAGKSASDGGDTTAFGKKSQSGATLHQRSTRTDSHKHQSAASTSHQGQPASRGKGSYAGRPGGNGGAPDISKAPSSGSHAGHKGKIGGNY